ncbi:Small RNA 2'-O-methyltransferase [Rhizophlyctis rosea]|nr:Small RNA 2'-O-methyltransferase [Rhizophlyctis rosea]
MAESTDSNTPKEDEENTTPLFNPPLWRQRRAMVSQILKKHRVESVSTDQSRHLSQATTHPLPSPHIKVLDFGCGQGALLEILLNDTSFSRLAGVDIDPACVESTAMACQPNEYDKRFLRELPVECSIYQGSVAEADSRLCGFDAIASAEVVEHLDPPVLEAFPETTLGIYRPRVMVVTTPNGDFNVNFPGLKWGTPEAEFRNDDHRFEWSREEFQSWCGYYFHAHLNRAPNLSGIITAPPSRAKIIASKYNYTVSFTGVGLLSTPTKHPDVGHCTQIAIFTRIDTQPPSPLPTIGTPYRYHSTITFPYFTETGFTNKDIIDEAVERTRYLVYNELDDRRNRDVKNGDEDLGKGPPQARAGEIMLPLEKYWNILRIRQICKKLDRLIEAFRSEEAKEFFEIVRIKSLDGQDGGGEDLGARFMYDIPPEEERQDDALEWEGTVLEDEYEDGEDGWGEEEEWSQVGENSGVGGGSGGGGEVAVDDWSASPAGWGNVTREEDGGGGDEVKVAVDDWSASPAGWGNVPRQEESSLSGWR